MTITKKRFVAYIIDILLLGFIVLLINNFIFKNNTGLLYQNINDISEQLLLKNINLKQWFNQYAVIIRQIDLENSLINLIKLILTLIYFVFIPYINSGQTYGQKIMKLYIKPIQDEKLTLQSLMIRNIIINGIAYLIICLSLIYIFRGVAYFVLISTLGLIQLMLVIISIIMILYRRDKRGLQDIISKTKIVELNGE